MELKKKFLKKKPSSRIQRHKDSRTWALKAKEKTSVLKNQSKGKKEIEKAKAEQYSSIIAISYRVYVIKVIVPFFTWAEKNLAKLYQQVKKEAVRIYNNY